jgi:hypothetical protein
MRGSDRLRRHPELPESLAGSGDGTAQLARASGESLTGDLLENARNTKTRPPVGNAIPRSTVPSTVVSSCAGMVA